MDVETVDPVDSLPKENSDSTTDKSVRNLLNFPSLRLICGTIFQSKRLSVRSMKKGANRVLEEVKNAFTASTSSPTKASLAKADSGSLVRHFFNNRTHQHGQQLTFGFQSRKLSLKSLAGSLTGSIKKKLASSLQSILVRSNFNLTQPTVSWVNGSFLAPFRVFSQHVDRRTLSHRKFSE